MVTAPKDLFAPWQGRLALGQLELRTVRVLDQLVDDAERRRVGTRPHPRPDAERVDGRTSRHEIGYAVLVQVTRREDATLAQAAVVEDRSHLARQHVQVAGVEPYRGDADALHL